MMRFKLSTKKAKITLYKLWIDLNISLFFCLFVCLFVCFVTEVRVTFFPCTQNGSSAERFV